MDEKAFYALAADLLLLSHALFVAFVVFGLLLVFIGKGLAWSWIRNPWFRLLHLISIGIVVFQSWLGIVCPLTSWEMTFRQKTGDAVYSGTFVSHWLETVLYYRAPEWVFVMVYTAFGLLVVASWFWAPPRPLPGFRKPARHPKDRLE